MLQHRKGFTYKGYRIKLINEGVDWYAEATGPEDIDVGPVPSEEQATELIKIEIDKEYDTK